MDDGIDWNLIAKYLSGEATADEEAKVHAWASEDSRRAALLEELRQVWHMTDTPGSTFSTEQSWDSARIWQRVQEETGQESAPEETADRFQDAASSDSSGGEREDRASRRRSTSPQRTSHPFASRTAVGRAAAVVVLVAAVAFAVIWSGPFISESGGGEARVETFATEEGQRARVRLNDGSLVHLNVDSRLIVAEAFGPSGREVRLEGEAFFEVAKDSTRPFVVRTAESTTRVLGTAFDVSAYPEDEETRVVVKEGRVAMSAADSTSEEELSSEGEERPFVEKQGVVLGRGQNARLLRGSTKIVSDSGGVASYLAWMEGRLVFEDASFQQAVRKLERWYDLKITLKDADTATPAGHLNAQFDEDQGLEEVLEVVATAFGMEFERPRSERVIFYSPSRSADDTQSTS